MQSWEFIFQNDTLLLYIVTFYFNTLTPMIHYFFKLVHETKTTWSSNTTKLDLTPVTYCLQNPKCTSENGKLAGSHYIAVHCEQGGPKMLSNCSPRHDERVFVSVWWTKKEIKIWWTKEIGYEELCLDKQCCSLSPAVRKYFSQNI